MKKIMMIVMMCLMLVGCGKDYGIFTKEGYDLLTETEREEVGSCYEKMIGFIDGVESDEYVDLGEYSMTSNSNDTSNLMYIKNTFMKMQLSLLDTNSDYTESVAKYVIEKDDITQYFNDDSMDKLSISKEEVKEFKQR